MKRFLLLSAVLLGPSPAWRSLAGNAVTAQHLPVSVSAPTAASSLVADYQFRGSLGSAVSGAPVLTNLGANAFELATVDDSVRQALAFDPNNGLSLPTAGLVAGQSYTVVMLFSLTTTNDYRRLMDFKNGASNRGLYCYFGRLIFLTSQLNEGGGVTLTPNNFVQVALTRNSAGTVTGYLNGVRQLSFTDTGGDAVIDAGQTLRFFRDNNNDGEASAGQIVRLRLYNEALSGSRIAALDRLPNQQADCPSFSGLNPAGGTPGTSFQIQGSGLNGVNGVRFAGNVAAGFTVNDETQLTVTVPAGAVTGTLTLSKAGCGDVLSSAVFTVPGSIPSSLAADYQFQLQSNLRSTVNSPPPLIGLGNTAFETVAVDNRQRRLLRFDQNNGLALFSTAGVVPNQAYTIVMLFALGRTNDYRRLVEFKNGTNNRGLYVYFDRLAFLTNRLWDGASGVVRPNTFVQVALTRDSGNNVTGYVNGSPQFSFADTEGAALIEGNALRFFRDNAGDAEASDGYVARIRLYNTALSGNEIAALDRLPTGSVSTVSAASFAGPVLAGESIAAAFGSELATAIQIAGTVPLPTQLAGTTVRVKDNLGVERLSPLFFVAPTQVNYQIPQGVIPGLAVATIAGGNGAVSVGSLQIASVAPGLFTANASGQGVVNGLALRVNANGAQSFEPLARFDSALGQFVAVPIDLGAATDQLFLILYGTGWRGRSGLPAVSMKIGGADAEVLYAGPQGDFVGLDQINVRLPRSLAGRGEVNIGLTVDGSPANTVKVAIR